MYIAPPVEALFSFSVVSPKLLKQEIEGQNNYNNRLYMYALVNELTITLIMFYIIIVTPITGMQHCHC